MPEMGISEFADYDSFALAAEISRVRGQRDQLRAALAALICADGREELEQMEIVMRAMPAPARDKAATIDALHALMDTLPS